MGSLYDDAELLLGFPPEIYNPPLCILTCFVAEEVMVKLPPVIVAFEDTIVPLNVPLVAVMFPLILAADA